MTSRAAFHAAASVAEAAGRDMRRATYRDLMKGGDPVLRAVGDVFLAHLAGLVPEKPKRGKAQAKPRPAAPQQMSLFA